MAVVVVVSYPLFWRGGQATRAIVKRDGLVVLDVALNAPRMLQVQGALGVSVIEIQPGRARVRADPGPRQYCVQQGWLTRAHAVAICAPNHISLQLSGDGGDYGGYDSLNY
ncbi:MAG TPA: NusG domain II-containing protein [Rhodocyclaceae bacterium]|nr:NusG domain II-containing protein [Rhodocyclaceae bacterium]